MIQEINLKLPACVYIPFVKDSDQYSNILNIVFEETRIFSTKQRAPFYICLEVFNPIEAFSEVLK
jgi:phosphatidylinositol 4-kinase